MQIIEILGSPIPLNRPRAVKRGNYVTIYDSQHNEKNQVQWQIRSQYRERPILCPLYLDILFAFPIPKHTSKVRTREMLENKLPPAKKPDIDNLIKFILDCLNNILFDDDSQIVDIRARKIYSLTPRTVVRAVKYDEITEFPSNLGKNKVFQNESDC